MTKIPKSDWIMIEEPSYYPNLTGYENLLVFQKWWDLIKIISGQHWSSLD